MKYEDWQLDIIARDCLDYECLISRISNILYPEIYSATERERKLKAIPEMQRLAGICSERTLKWRNILREHYNNSSLVNNEEQEKERKMNDVTNLEQTVPVDQETLEAALVKATKPEDTEEVTVQTEADTGDDVVTLQ